MSSLIDISVSSVVDYISLTASTASRSLTASGAMVPILPVKPRSHHVKACHGSRGELLFDRRACRVWPRENHTLSEARALHMCVMSHIARS
jgi:hypothetical protein